jgi:hypothetical protein
MPLVDATNSCYVCLTAIGTQQRKTIWKNWKGMANTKSQHLNNCNMNTTSTKNLKKLKGHG